METETENSTSPDIAGKDCYKLIGSDGQVLGRCSMSTKDRNKPEVVVAMINHALEFLRKRSIGVLHKIEIDTCEWSQKTAHAFDNNESIFTVESTFKVRKDNKIVSQN